MSPMNKTQHALIRLNRAANTFSRTPDGAVTNGVMADVLGDVAECLGELVAEIDTLRSRIVFDEGAG
jgi:hypothetical protein